MTTGSEHTDLGEVLAVLREHAVALTAALAHPPARIRVEAAGAAVELGWSSGPVPTPTPGTTSGPTSGTTPGTTQGPVPASAPEPPAGSGPAPLTNGSGASTVATAHRITAPTVGTFYRAPDPQAGPFVSEGDVVVSGQQVAIIEAMKLMIPVEADRGGRVVEVLCGNGEPVEYGQALIVVDAS